MSMFEKVRTKPWLPDPDALGPDERADPAMDALKTKRLGLYIFMGVVTALFSLFAVGYYMRMMLGGWQMAPEPWILWANTVVLVLGSIFMQGATHWGGRGQGVLARWFFLLGGGAGIVFLVGQFVAWRELMALGFYASSNPANAFFYLLTGLHGLHLLGGLVVWFMVLRKTEHRGNMALCATYWHFMLVVWIGLFLLLIRT